MFRPLKIICQALIITLSATALCASGLLVEAQEAAGGFSALSKHLPIEAALAASQKSKRSRRRRTRRVRRRSTARRVVGKPREIQGVIVDSNDSMPDNNTTTAAAASTTPKPATPEPRPPVAGGVLNNQATSLPMPSYPPIAKAARASGTVVIRLLVDEQGNVIEADAISGHPLLQEAARKAALEAKFAPTLVNGQPVKVIGVLTYNFVP